MATGPVKQKEPLESGLFMCAGEDLNLHVLRHMALNHACLPVPAPAQKQDYYNQHWFVVNTIHPSKF